MSETNKALVRRFYEEVLNQKNVNAIDELCDPNVVDHGAFPGQAPGRQGVKDMFQMFLSAFPALRVSVDDVIAERDTVAVRLSGAGTHRGPLFGTAPTGKSIRFNAIDIIRIESGQAVEIWHQGDDAIALMQLGIAPPMPHA